MDAEHPSPSYKDSEGSGYIIEWRDICGEDLPLCAIEHAVSILVLLTTGSKAGQFIVRRLGEPVVPLGKRVVYH